MGLGSRLKQILEEKKISPADLANMSNVPQQTIYSLIRRDGNKIEIDYLIQISKALKINVDVFSSEFLNKEKEIRIDTYKEKLSSQDQNVLFCYHLLEGESKETVDFIFKKAYERYMSEKKEEDTSVS